MGSGTPSLSNSPERPTTAAPCAGGGEDKNRAARPAGRGQPTYVPTGMAVDAVPKLAHFLPRRGAEQSPGRGGPEIAACWPSLRADVSPGSNYTAAGAGCRFIMRECNLKVICTSHSQLGKN